MTKRIKSVGIHRLRAWENDVCIRLRVLAVAFWIWLMLIHGKEVSFLVTAHSGLAADITAYNTDPSLVLSCFRWGKSAWDSSGKTTVDGYSMNPTG